jgi:glucans biosynthesis protein C
MGIGAGLVFMLYQSFAQAFFMGLLFLVGGAFVPGAYERKGCARFIRDRLVRLGIPTLVFMLVLDPGTNVLMQVLRGAAFDLPATLSRYARFITSLQFLSASGPLWFAFALLVFSIIYALVRRAVELQRGKQAGAGSAVAVTHLRVAAVVAVIAAGSFLVRIVQPFGSSWFNMQLGNFTQYTVLFLVGLWAARADLLRTLSYRLGMSWFRVALAAGIPAWFIIGALGGALSGTPELLLGGLHWQAAAYALWESFFCVGMCMGLIVIYRQRVNVRATVSGFLADNAFGVYVFHTPVLVAISLLLRTLAMAPLAKACFVGALAVAASFLVAALIRLVPGLRRIFS